MLYQNVIIAAKQPFIQKILKQIAVFMLMLLFSCGNTKQIKASKAEIKQAPKIIFLTYNISKNENGTKIIECISQKTVAGKIKTKASEAINNGKPGDLICMQIDNKSNTLSSILIKDPLNKIVEFSNESMEFQTKTINIDETRFTVRMQLNHNATNITISTFANNKLLNKTKIN